MQYLIVVLPVSIRIGYLDADAMSASLYIVVRHAVGPNNIEKERIKMSMILVIRPAINDHK